MGRISRYGADATVELSDKLLGTDADGLTKNYTVSSLGTFINATHGSEGYINIAFNTTTGIITMTEVDGGTDTIDLGIGTGDTPSFAGMSASGLITGGSLESGGALTVDGLSSLSTTNIGGDATVSGSVKCQQNFRRTVTTASESSGTHTITLVDNDNFNIAVTNAATTIALVVATENIGQSGMITITNPASVGSLSFVALPSYMLTPEGATINFVTTANAVSIISYYVLATDKVLVNYVGNFA